VASEVRAADGIDVEVSCLATAVASAWAFCPDCPVRSNAVTTLPEGGQVYPARAVAALDVPEFAGVSAVAAGVARVAVASCLVCPVRSPTVPVPRLRPRQRARRGQSPAQPQTGTSPR